ncbi:carbohydrate esterase family 1 protein [Plectosphaerella plurivora]|uniref:feruloyl esterase n=1 Tax=Plectosphaerella plurivora TaxID=936078 RepID=A0A9P8VL05_9PEZI|nr:carbohydrate esterase family 1 protein [Plectosphaerella plurivora]
MLLAILATCISVGLAAPQQPKQGCGGSLPDGMKPGNEYTMPYPGGGRDWLLFIPPNYSTSKGNPVVLSYHGGGKTPEKQRDLDLLEKKEFNTDYVVAYPRGIDERWEGTPDIKARDDVGYTVDILDEISRKLCVDKNRVYMSGKSNGGGFVGLAACNQRLSTRIAAFAAVSGSFYIQGKDNCNPSTVPLTCDKGSATVPMLEIHGGRDTTIKYAGDSERRGACLPGVLHWVEEWAARDGVKDKASKAGKTDWAGEAEVRSWGRGKDGFGVVTHVYDAKLAHSWPSKGENADNGGKGNGDGPASFDATAVILRFFGGYKLGEVPK